MNRPAAACAKVEPSSKDHRFFQGFNNAKGSLLVVDQAHKHLYTHTHTYATRWIITDRGDVVTATLDALRRAPASMCQKSQIY